LGLTLTAAPQLVEGSRRCRVAAFGSAGLVSALHLATLALGASSMSIP